MSNRLSHKEVFAEMRQYFNKGRKSDEVKFLFSKAKDIRQLGGRKMNWGELKTTETTSLSYTPQSQSKFINTLHSLTHDELNEVNALLSLEKTENQQEIKKNIINQRIKAIINGEKIWSL